MGQSYIPGLPTSLGNVNNMPRADIQYWQLDHEVLTLKVLYNHYQAKRKSCLDVRDEQNFTKIIKLLADIIGIIDETILMDALLEEAEKLSAEIAECEAKLTALKCQREAIPVAE